MDYEDEHYDEVDSGNESSEDDVDFVMEDISLHRDRHNDVDDYPFEVLSTEEIVKHMVDCIKEVNTVVEMPTTVTRILLNHFKWDKEKLMERFYDGDQEKLFLEARVINPFEKIITSTISTPKIINGTEECQICFIVLPSSRMTGLECGHRFCTDCWVEYLTTKIMEEGVGQTIACASHDCEILVDDATVMRLVKEPHVKVKYQHLITNSFVECNRLLRWCPSPNCCNAIKVQYVDFHKVQCKCNHIFCFACGQNWHDPVKCHLLQKWIKKCEDDSETSHWIAANTKECPKCNAIIEKIGGCNHMVCKQPNCQHNFCWICLGPWSPHGSSWYSCNIYHIGDAKTARTSLESSRFALKRYLFFCNRYMNHMASLKFENKLYNGIKTKMEEMQHHNMSWIEVQFLKRAVDILVQCRQTLMFTYVFAFYLKKTNQSVIFEDNQKDLESATETLSEYLERDITCDNFISIKQKVQDKCRYCDSRRKALLEHVHEGYETEWWCYNE